MFLSYRGTEEKLLGLTRTVGQQKISLDPARNYWEKLRETISTSFILAVEVGSTTRNFVFNYFSVLPFLWLTTAGDHWSSVAWISLAHYLCGSKRHCRDIFEIAFKTR